MAFIVTSGDGSGSGPGARADADSRHCWRFRSKIDLPAAWLADSRRLCRRGWRIPLCFTSLGLCTLRTEPLCFTSLGQFTLRSEPPFVEPHSHLKGTLHSTIRSELRFALRSPLCFTSLGLYASLLRHKLGKFS
jgi:hypothetical protein